MAITSLDNAIAGMKPPEFFTKGVTGNMTVNRTFNLNYLTGIPGAAAANTTAGLSGAALTSWTGQLPIPAASGSTHLARMVGYSSAAAGVLLLCDRLWHNTVVVTSTTGQTINSVTWPARDADGATTGRGVYIGAEVGATVGAATPSLTLSYTNSAGVSGRSATNLLSFASASTQGNFYQFGLAAGDVGVQSIQTYTQSASLVSGTVNLVAYRILAALEIGVAGIPRSIDALTSGMPRLYDTSVPFLLWLPGVTTTTALSAQIVYTQG